METKEASKEIDLIQIEANIDNMNPEFYSPLLDILLQAGANDAWLTPIIMKKGRPAILLSVLANHSQLDELSEIIFQNTTTIGFRFFPVNRIICEREFSEFLYEGQQIHIKRSYYKGQLVNTSLEYEDLKQASHVLQIPLKDLQQKVWQALPKEL
ncbi:nickel insertion protein [Veillonella intestinalis]|uniref:nickel insertion protein n=1 Tax=Veillonella intestinalis TaxID=2941341 RepID=UPI00203B8168|nr:nickel insertion protein [Veillonella intestinalis]